MKLVRRESSRSLMEAAFERAAAPIRARRGRLNDPNFIGFDKYRRDGAYHWVELERSDDYRARIDLVMQYAAPGAACLDIGCGDGAYAYALSQKVESVVGVDADFDAIRHASKELQRRHVDNVRCMQMLIADLSLGSLGVSAPFDVVYSMDVIEHLPEPAQLLDRACALVAPTGRVVIGTPRNLGDALMSEYHVREFEVDELLALLDPWIHVDDVHLIPMLRLDHAIHPDGFIVVAGRPR